MSQSWAQLRAMTMDELIAAHDGLAPSTGVGVAYYLEEIARRESAAREERMVRLTRIVVALTVVITALTVCNLVFVAAK